MNSLCVFGRGAGARVLGVLLLVAASAGVAAENAGAVAQLYGDQSLDRSYRRLLPLEGGSNFRDMGGYPTLSGKRVVRGQLFRSGAPTSLTESDWAYLAQFGFKTAVDLRSSEERELFPNAWVASSPTIDYRYVDYSVIAMMQRTQGQGSRPAIGELYRGMPLQIAPQLRLYFDALLHHHTPVVVNCSAGQDRTGVTAAILLSLLGVSREWVVEDYLLSTDFRRPRLEMGDIDLEAAAKTNAFAKMMLGYRDSSGSDRANPLVTADGVAYIEFALDQIEQDYGSVEGYLQQVIGFTPEQIQQLRELYLEG